MRTERERLERDEKARELWREVYGPLSDGKPGLLGSVTSRAEAQVLRLSCLYALLDRSAIVHVPHLEAALAVWDYAEASARYIFGDATGDRVADEIEEALRTSPDGMSRTEIRDLFGRHQGRARIQEALSILKNCGRVRVERVATDGRPAECWRIA